MAGQMGNMNMGGASMPQGFNPNFGVNPSIPSAAMAGGFPPQVALPPNLAAQQAQTQRQYQARLQQQTLQSNMAAQQQRLQSAGLNNPMMAAAGQHPNMAAPAGPQGAMNAQQQQQVHVFINKVAKYMHQLGQPFDPNPTMAGRPINLYTLFHLVLRAQGSSRITSNNQWPQLARALGFPEQQYPQAGAELKDIFARYLGAWEAAYFSRQQQDPRAKMEAMNQQGQMGPMAAPQHMTPTKQMPQIPTANQVQQQYMQQLQQRMQQQQQQQQQQGQMPMTPTQNNAQLPTANGFSTPQPEFDPARQQNAVNQHRKSASKQVDASPANQQPDFPTPSPGPAVKTEDRGLAKTVNGVATAVPAEEESPTSSTNYKPNIGKLDRWGGIHVEQSSGLGEKIAMLKPVVPNIEEMGIIDLRAMSLSLESGIHAEVRYALDHLVKLSFDNRVAIDLEQCEDLVDIILDCGEAQVDLLERNCPEVSDVIDLNSYEEVVRVVKVEMHGLQNIPEAGTLEYDLDRAADRLVAVTTLLRNFSFIEKNQMVLAGNPVIKFLSNTIRLLGTRNMFLRSHNNTQDFMKDVVTFLSNVSDKVSLPSREDAISILHFLLSFAPSPAPTASKNVRFAFYDPRIHRYYPPAIDSLAKLLARDDPNKTLYKHLFTDNVPSSSTAHLPPHQQYDLLTRAFALAVAIIPDRTAPAFKSGSRELRVAEARKASLTQGMLAADILLSLAPAEASGLAKAWVTSEDGWAPSLLRLVAALSGRAAGSGPAQGSLNGLRGQQGRAGFVGTLPPHLQAQREELGFEMVVRRGLDVIKRLAGRIREGMRVGRKGSVGKAVEGQANGEGVANLPSDEKEGDGSAEREGEGQGEPEASKVSAGEGTRPEMDGNGQEKEAEAKAEAEAEVGGEAETEDEDDDTLDEDWHKAVFWKGVLGEALPKEHSIVGALLTDEADGFVIKELLALSNLDA